MNSQKPKRTAKVSTTSTTTTKPLHRQTKTPHTAQRRTIKTTPQFSTPSTSATSAVSFSTSTTTTTLATQPQQQQHRSKTTSHRSRPQPHHSPLSPIATTASSSPQSFFQALPALLTNPRQFFSTTTTPPNTTTTTPDTSRVIITQPSPAARTRRDALNKERIANKAAHDAAILQAKRQEILKMVAKSAKPSKIQPAMDPNRPVKKSRAELYDSGDEIDESEEEHNKKMLRLGKFDALDLIDIKFHKKQTPLQKYLALPQHNHKIEKIKARTKILSKPSQELTQEDLEILVLCDVGNTITRADEHEYKLWQDVKAQAFKRFSLKFDKFEFGEPEDQLTERERRKLQEAQEAESEVGMDALTKFRKQQAAHQAAIDASLIDDASKQPFSEDWSPQDYTKFLQKLWGQPENGNPEILYVPGVKLLWRQDRAPLDKNGNALPINYATHHLHDPYDYFSPDTSTVYDPPINPISDPDDAKRCDAYINFTMEEQIMNLRQTLQCPRELNAFDSVLVATLLPKFYAQFIGQNDFSKPYADRHWLYETLNHPDPQQRYIPQIAETGSWEDFFLYDISTGPRKLKWFTVGMFGIMLGFTALMALEGTMACQQYFYDLEHPFHH